MASAPVLSVVVPTRNEAETLPLLVDRLLAVMAGVALEICIVDDSDDATPAVVAGLAERHPEAIRPLLRSGAERHGGLSTAVIAGLQMARGRFVCVMDADLQHPPETIAVMLEAAEQGADLVVASRYAAGGSHGGLDGGARRIVSRAATLLARLLFFEARRSRDPLSGFFLCRRALVDGVVFRPVGFKVLLELLVLLPNIEVVDVPLRFERRAAGSSKATMAQGLHYLGHLRSLILDVQGSARLWKFGLVGLSGLLVFLPLLGILSGPAGLPDIAAFVPAFVASMLWNWTLNRHWTFADMRARPGGHQRGYPLSALGSGVFMFGVYVLLVTAGWPALADGAVAALLGMTLNGIFNLGSVKRAPEAWSRLVSDRGLEAALQRVADRLGGDRVYALPPPRHGLDDRSLVGELVARAVDERRAVLCVAAPSYRPQRRTNIATESIIVVPVVRDDEPVAAVVVERSAPRGFDQDDLDAAVHAVLGLGELLGGGAPLGSAAGTAAEPGTNDVTGEGAVTMAGRTS